MRNLRFQQGFALERYLLSRLLSSIEVHNLLSQDAQGSFMGVNKPKVEGIRGWAVKTALLNTSSKSAALTTLGKLLLSQDQDLNAEGTLWLLHYFLSVDHGERSDVWFYGFNHFLSAYQTFSPNELKNFIENYLDNTPSNKQGINDDSNQLVRAYTQTDALGGLQLMTKLSKTEYRVALSSAPPPLISAFMLFETWNRRYPNIDTLRLSQIAKEPEFLGRILVAEYDQVRAIILDLQRLGLLTFTDNQHEPVTRLFRGTPLSLLEQYYQQL